MNDEQIKADIPWSIKTCMCCNDDDNGDDGDDDDDDDNDDGDLFCDCSITIFVHGLEKLF